MRACIACYPHGMSTVPRKPRKPCQYPQCIAMAERGRFCADHAPDEERPSAAVRGYGSQWRMIRARVLSAAPLCADPYGVHAQEQTIVIATDVDHIIAKAKGGSDRYDNLQPLCHSCHSRKTATVDRYAPKG